MEQRLRSFLDKVAQAHNLENHRIESYQTTSKGANFTSKVFLPIISSPGKPDLKLFAKTSVFDEQLRSLMRFNIFNTEVLFYSELVPRYKQLEDACNIPEEGKLLVPKYYGGSRDYLNELLIFENLVERGFQDFNRFQCYDWDYASKCVEQLAILHSLSIAYAGTCREEFESLTQNMQIGFSGQFLQHYLDNCTALAIKVCREDNKEKLKDFIKKYINKETFDKFTKPQRRPCLIHGDFRPSNIMHKVNKNNDLEVIMLDYQIMQRGNPLFDLMYFIASGSDANFRAKYFHKLLNHYYTALSRALLRLDVVPDKVYSKEDFDADVKLFLPYGLMLAILVLPIVTVDETKAPDLHEFIDGQDVMEDPRPNLTERLNDFIDDFIEMGVL